MTKEEMTEAVGLMIRSLRRHRCLCEKQIGELAVHHSQHKMLMNIAKSKEPSTQKELAKKLGISAAAASVSVKRLEADGYICRTSNGEDMRKNSVTLTDKGADIIRISRDIFAGVDSKMFEGISDAEFQVLCECLKKMSDNMKGEKDEKMA